MPSFKIAHVNQQGVDLIVVPLDESFGSKTTEDQQAAIRELQAHAVSAGLRGRVVPVWDSGGRMAFIAPSQWHAFFQNIGLPWVMANLNRQLYW